MTMTTVPNSHIVTDETGKAFIAGTRFKVRFIAYAAMDGQTPQQMKEAWPQLTLAQIHAGISYYYDHQAAFDEEARKSSEQYARDREEAIRTGKQPTREQLEARLANRAAG
ncbi:MAG TPA: DUF433 domain-containing protein [Phycisphaerae bacterium]|nr:DUF433 domain-containing protein [Phycisphaerae bacterium]